VVWLADSVVEADADPDVEAEDVTVTSPFVPASLRGEDPPDPQPETTKMPKRSDAAWTEL
jgi:hypothetical protein